MSKKTLLISLITIVSLISFVGARYIPSPAESEESVKPAAEQKQVEHAETAEKTETESRSSSARATHTPERRVESATARNPIRVVVVPHPDDEVFSGGSMLNGEHIAYSDESSSTKADIRVVMVLMTQGEATSYCEGEGLPGLDMAHERRPNGSSCAEMRVDSWHAFLDAATNVSQEDRYVFNGGDGRLQASYVVSAVQDVLDIYRNEPLQDVVCACYWNDDEEAGSVYTHRDHLATRQALESMELEVPLLVSTTHSHSNVIADVPVEMHQHANHFYGWLTGGAWYGNDTDDRRFHDYWAVREPKPTT